MRHLKKGRKFGRERNQRKALMKSMAASFFISGRIHTSEAKAKSLRPFVEKFLARAKNPTLANRRYIASRSTPRAAAQLFASAAALGTRPGGYTRIIKTGRRARDNAKLAILELVK